MLKKWLGGITGRPGNYEPTRGAWRLTHSLRAFDELMVEVPALPATGVRDEVANPSAYFGYVACIAEKRRLNRPIIQAMLTSKVGASIGSIFQITYSLD